MTESLTISKQPPERKSMDYAHLRELGISKVQELAGALWTDYNSHDPGITILEVLCYALTDLGYRVNYDIKDILARADDTEEDIRNFYSACQILPVCPVNFDDYRKLLIDVDILDETSEGCKHAGVKNAWIDKSSDPAAEHKIYVDRKYSKLSLDPVDNISDEEQEFYYVKVLYDVLLEFDKCDKYGDLNSNVTEVEMNLQVPEDPFPVNMRTDFRRWDEPVDWNLSMDPEIHIEQVRLRFPDLQGGAELVLSGGLAMSNIVIKKGGLDFVNQAWLDLLVPFVNNQFEGYVEKINKIFEIVEEVKKRLNANRNLCDDFFRVKALKIEEILLCADIELSPQADVEQVEAEIFHNVTRFLSPTVYFYTLDEMINRCRKAPKYTLHQIRKQKRTFTISDSLTEILNQDDRITVIASESNFKEYTVKCIQPNRDTVDFTDIEVVEEVSDDTLSSDAHLIKGVIEEDRCLKVDRIFEGPKLTHGFIDDEELEKARRMKYIHVSDLIRIIMDVEGVVAVRDIQIANRPQDNESNIESKSVLWCLKLAFEDNYVPRLNIGDSNLTFFKDQIPFKAKPQEVRDLLEDLEKTGRKQKIYYPHMDIPIPQGEYLDIERFTSIQEEFPEVYGIGSRGIPGLGGMSEEDIRRRRSKSRQLKGFLLFFDQFLANYLSQLSHVKDLFSMNKEKNEFGEYAIDKTYFSQPLFDVVPDAGPLYVNETGHMIKLEEIMEDKDLYEKRRNKFLDHLLGRFAESFTDYALLIYKHSGAKAPAELIEDKLNFLDAYPDISKARGKGFDYRHPCQVWHVDNLSGYKKRVSLLLGMPEREINDLVFSPNFIIEESSGVYSYKLIHFPDVTTLIKSPLDSDLTSELNAKARLEELIINGSCRENYRITPIDEVATNFKVELWCNDRLLAVSEREDFNSDLSGGDADSFIQDLIDQVVFKEYCENHESNRKNLASPLLNYIEYEVTANMTPPDNQPPRFEIQYKLYSIPFAFVTDNLLLEGTLLGAGVDGGSEAEVLEKGEALAKELLCDMIGYGTSRENYAFDSDEDGFSDYTAILCNRSGVEIGRSPLSDYNQILAEEINELGPGSVVIGEVNNFTPDIAVAKGANVEITLTSSPDPALADEKLFYQLKSVVNDLDPDNRKIILPEDSAPRLYPGDEIELRTMGGSIDYGTYSVMELEKSGTELILSVREPIQPDDAAALIIAVTREFEVISIDGNLVIIRGTEHERMVAQLIDFIVNKFSRHEGIHVIEHTLLRPRINFKEFLPADSDTLDDTILNLGDLVFEKSVPVISVHSPYKMFTVSGNVIPEIYSDHITIEGGSPNDGEYTIQFKYYYAPLNRTLIWVLEDLLFDLPADGIVNGKLIFRKKTEIGAVDAPNLRIVVSDPDAESVPANSIIEIMDSGGLSRSNDGLYQVGNAAPAGGGLFRITISHYEFARQDALLPIYLDADDCESCQQVDPYSCVVSVVLPYWTGKLKDPRIREFVEKTLRLEAPAHLLLNICWIDCQQMAEFECKYKKWLIEVNKPSDNTEQQMKALAEFIDIISRLRNIYPSGTLHSCDDDDSFEGSIILNNSVLGSF